MDIVFCPEKQSTYIVERATGFLISYSVREGLVGSKKESLPILGDWSIFEVHDMRISSNKLQLLGLTHKYILCLIEVDLDGFHIRRRLVSSMWGEAIGNQAKICMESVNTETEIGANIIVCHDMLTDTSVKLDPNQTETSYKPTVIFVSEQAMGPWVEMPREKANNTGN